MKKILTIILSCVASFAIAQNTTVKGTVVTKGSQEPLAGVSVQRGETIIATDAAGKFSIQAAAGDDILFSFIGMKPQTIKVADISKDLMIEMEPAITSGDVVVVTGYTAQRKKDVTGAVAIVDLDPVKNNSSGNAMQALQGRVAGLYIERGSGSPNGGNARILIRGANTLGNTDPLYIIDGVPTTRSEVIQNIDPASIASMQVLKDASAASIYGSRASNGVIIVTTKNGGNTDGRVNFQFNTSVSAQSEKSVRFEMLNAIDRGKALWQASVNDRQNPNDAYGEIYTFDWNNDFDNPVLNSVNVKPFVGGDPNTPTGNTDWQDVMYKTGLVTNNSLTASVGSKNSSLEINIGHFKNTGMLRYTGYERLQGSVNAITRAFNNKLTFGVNLRAANSDETLAGKDIGGALTTALAVFQAPTIPVY